MSLSILVGGESLSLVSKDWAALVEAYAAYRRGALLGNIKARRQIAQQRWKELHALTDLGVVAQTISVEEGSGSSIPEHPRGSNWYSTSPPTEKSGGWS